MEFNFSVNALFKERIIKVKNNLLPDTHTSDRHGDGDVVSKISTILDKMGAESSKAQNLPRTITNATKLRNSDHVVYFLADPTGNKGHGTVVGLLKVGWKKLFVYDKGGNQMEIEPLCVLDFYVHESQQRTGCGHFLFEHMLQDQQIGPQHLALDQPSDSFLKFMNKHYALDTIMPQNNGFVVYDTFFKDRAGSESIRAPKQSNLFGNPVHTVKTSSRSGSSLPAYGRHSAKKAGDTMAQYMHDGETPYINGKSQRQAARPTSNGFAGSAEFASRAEFSPRPTTLPDKLNGLSISSPSKGARPATRSPSPQPPPPAAPVQHAPVQHAPPKQAPPKQEEPLSSAASDGDDVDSLQDAQTPEKLDLKFYHSRLW